MAVENIGGIDHAEVLLDNGTTVLVGQNATNRTSFIQAMCGVLGGTRIRLKSDADQGEIRMQADGEEYSRTFTRSGTQIIADGTPYVDDSELVDLFVSLDSENPLRRAIRNGEDIRDIIMDPVDTAAIKRQINDLERERSEIDDRLDEIDRQANRLPTLEERRQSLIDKKDDIEADLEDVKQEIEDYEATEEELERANELRGELREKQEELNEIQDRLELNRKELDNLDEEKEEVQGMIDYIDLPDVDEDELDERYDELSEEIATVSGEISDISSIVDFNRRVLEGNVSIESDAGAHPVSELDPTSQEVICWTCGSTVERSEIQNHMDEWNDILTKKYEKRDKLRERRNEIEERKTEIDSARERKEELEDRLSGILEEIKYHNERITERNERLDELRDEIAEIEQRASEAEELRESELPELFQQQSDLEYDRGRVDGDLDDVNSTINEIEAEVEQEDALQEERQEIHNEIHSLRDRITTLEEEIIAKFNEHMDDILSLLAYENLERVWLERKLAQGATGNSRFDLHIVREGEAGVYEDTIDNVSESEREVIGLIVALAGYLAHDVYEAVPFILMDSLEAIDAYRLGDLVDYFDGFADYLIVALLPEDEATIADTYDRIQADALA